MRPGSPIGLRVQPGSGTARVCWDGVDNNACVDEYRCALGASSWSSKCFGGQAGPSEVATDTAQGAPHGHKGAPGKCTWYVPWYFKDKIAHSTLTVTGHNRQGYVSTSTAGAGLRHPLHNARELAVSRVCAQAVFLGTCAGCRPGVLTAQAFGRPPGTRPARRVGPLGHQHICINSSRRMPLGGAVPKPPNAHLIVRSCTRRSQSLP